MSSVRPSEYNQKEREDGGPFLIVVPHPETPEGEDPEQVTIYYSEAPESEIDDATPIIRLMSVHRDMILIWPTETRSYHRNFLKPKYESLRQIIVSKPRVPFEIPQDQHEVEALLRRLPSGLAKDFRFGLGFLWEYRQIVEAIEEISGIETLIITGGDVASIELDEKSFVIGEKRLEHLRKEINRTSGRFRADALRDKRHLIYHELLHVADSVQYPAKRKTLRKDLISDLTRGGLDVANVSPRDRRAAVKLVENSARKLAETEPRSLLALRAEIELASLSELIEQFDVMLNKPLQETSWQRLFQDNPFILSLAFAVPVFYIQGSAYVGGKRLDGRGGKFADFVYATAHTGNLALIEIKKPSTELLRAKPYRGAEVFGPSNELGGAIAQLLDQKQKLVQEMPLIKANSERADIHAHSIKGIIVAGMLPVEPIRQRSFELVRGAVSQVDIITFDELRRRLAAVKEALTPPEISPVPVPGANQALFEPPLPAWLGEGRAGVKDDF